MHFRAIGTCLAIGLVLAEVSSGQSVPQDTCILQFNVPAEVKLSVEGRDYGAQRRLQYDGLKPGQTYKAAVDVRFPDGSQLRRSVWIQAGRRVTVPALAPSAARPELMLQAGHAQNSYDSSAFSPDGRYLLTGSSDSTAILWETATGRQLRTYAGHAKTVVGVAFSPDGSKLITGSYDDTVIVWERDTGHRLRTISADSCYSIALSPDGQQVVVGEHEKRATLWDTATGRKSRTFEGAHTKVVRSVAFGPDGRQVATGSEDKTAVLWDVATGRAIHRLGPHRAEVKSIAFSPDGRHVVTASGESDSGRNHVVGDLVLWDLARGNELRRLELPRDFSRVVYTPDGQQLVGFSYGDSIEACVHKADDLSLVKNVPGVSSFAPSTSRDGRFLFSSGSVWDRQTGKEACRFKGEQGAVRSVAVAPSQPQLLVNLISPALLIEMDKATEVHRFALPSNEYAFSRMALADEGRRVFFVNGPPGGDPKEIVVFDVATAAQASRFPVASDYVSVLSVAAEGRRALTVSKRKASLWDVDSGKALRTFGSDAHSVHRAALSPDGRYVLTDPLASQAPSEHPRYLQNMSTLWDADSGTEIRNFQVAYEYKSKPHDYPSYNFAFVGFSPDGRTAVTAGEEYGVHSKNRTGLIVFSDLATGQNVRLLRGHSAIVEFVVFTPDGRYAASYSRDNTCIVWEVATGTNLGLFPSHTNYLYPPAITADGSRLLTVSEDGSIRIWDVATGDEMVRLVRLRNGWLAVTPEGLFDGPPETRENVGFRVGKGLEVVAVDRFFQDFYHPGLLAEIWRGGRPIPEVRFATKAAPLVRLEPGVKSGDIETREVTFKVEVSDRGGGIKGPWLVHNGSQVLVRGEPLRKGKLIERTFTVPLIEGENRLEVRAACEDGSWESEPATLVFHYRAAAQRPNLHLLAVGISRYAKETFNLKFAAADAQAVAELFSKRAPPLYGEDKVHITQVLDAQATKAGIKKALADVAQKMRPEDTFLLFLAGHGTMVGQRYYFITHDFQQQAERVEDDIRQQALPGDELDDALRAMPALKRVVIYDTCQSGGAVAINRTARDPFAFRGALERMSRATGSFTIAAAAASASAHEIGQLQHGVLTYALLAGLGAAREGPLANQPITTDKTAIEVRDWFSFAQDKVPLITRLFLGEEQLVGFSGQGSSFPLLPATK